MRSLKDRVALGCRLQLLQWPFAHGSPQVMAAMQALSAPLLKEAGLHV